MPFAAEGDVVLAVDGEAVLEAGVEAGGADYGVDFAVGV